MRGSRANVAGPANRGTCSGSIGPRTSRHVPLPAGHHVSLPSGCATSNGYRSQPAGAMGLEMESNQGFVFETD